jgi:hypothetical protein
MWLFAQFHLENDINGPSPAVFRFDAGKATIAAPGGRCQYPFTPLALKLLPGHRETPGFYCLLPSGRPVCRPNDDCRSAGCSSPRRFRNASVPLACRQDAGGTKQEIRDEHPG